MGDDKNLEDRIVLLERTVAQLLQGQVKPADWCEGTGRPSYGGYENDRNDPDRICPYGDCRYMTTDRITPPHTYHKPPRRY